MKDEMAVFCCCKLRLPTGVLRSCSFRRLLHIYLTRCLSLSLSLSVTARELACWTASSSAGSGHFKGEDWEKRLRVFPHLTCRLLQLPSLFFFPLYFFPSFLPHVGFPSLISLTFLCLYFFIAVYLILLGRCVPVPPSPAASWSA